MCSASTRTLPGSSLNVLAIFVLRSATAWVETCTVSSSPSKRATAACGSRQVCCWTEVRNVPSNSSGSPAARALRFDCAARGLLLQREGGGRPADIAGPGRRRGRAFAGVVPLPLALGKQDRRFGFARGVRSDHAWQDLVVDLDRRQCGERRLAIDRGDGCDRFADEVDHAVVVEEGNGRRDAGQRARRREIDQPDPRAGMGRAQHRAFELPLMADVDGVDRGAGHLLPRFDRAASVPLRRRICRCRRRRRRERCCRRPRSGRGGRRARGRCPRGSGVAAPRAARQASWKAAASTMKPGVQNPHWSASRAMKAR